MEAVDLHTNWENDVSTSTKSFILTFFWSISVTLTPLLSNWEIIIGLFLSHASPRGVWPNYYRVQKWKESKDKLYFEYSLQECSQIMLRQLFVDEKFSRLVASSYLLPITSTRRQHDFPDKPREVESRHPDENWMIRRTKQISFVLDFEHWHQHHLPIDQRRFENDHFDKRESKEYSHS